MKVTLAAAAVLIWTANAAAAPQQLDCALNSTRAAAAAQTSTIVVRFDQDAKTLQAQTASQIYSFGNVSISTVAISGSVGTVSLGIDRSSFGLVWQQYAPDKAMIMFGQCRTNPGPVASP